MSKKLTMACLALVAFAAFAIPATASASPEIGETSGGVFSRLAANTLIRGRNVGNWTFTNSSGNIVCTKVEMTGTLTENSGTSAKGDITSATFGGEGTNGDCTGPLGTSIQVITNEGNGVPWCLSANNEMAADEFQVRGNSCNLASRSITFRFNITGLNDCWYNREGVVKGSFTTDISGQDAVLTFSEQEWKLEKEEKTSALAPACPSTGKLDGAATLETDVEGTVPLYIK